MVEFTKEEFFKTKCNCYEDVARMKNSEKKKNIFKFLSQKKWMTMLIGCTSLMIIIDLIFIINFITIAQNFIW